MKKYDKRYEWKLKKTRMNERVSKEIRSKIDKKKWKSANWDKNEKEKLRINERGWNKIRMKIDK